MDCSYGSGGFCVTGVDVRKCVSMGGTFMAFQWRFWGGLLACIADGQGHLWQGVTYVAEETKRFAINTQFR